MVTKISVPKRLIAALNYNEQKVKKGSAVCLQANGYLREAGDLTFYQKLECLEMRNALNTRAATKSIHVSLNFDPSEKLSKERLVRIAERYMEGIGFDSQPYLVYQHQDASHPHLHIVASAIREDGSRINLHNLGKGASEKTRKAIELEFGLVQASSAYPFKQMPFTGKAVVYGQGETKSSMEGAITFVRRQYYYESLPQFATCLRQYGILVDTGEKWSRINRYGGILFKMVDENQRGVGVPIKGSRLASKPTVKNLEADFKLKAEGRRNYLPVVRHKIQKVLETHPGNQQALQDRLKQVSISLFFHASREGRVYGVTYLDNDIKAVYKGSELGKDFSAAALMLIDQRNGKKGLPLAPEEMGRVDLPLSVCLNEDFNRPRYQLEKQDTFLSTVLAAENQRETIQNNPFPKKRKRKKKRP